MKKLKNVKRKPRAGYAVWTHEGGLQTGDDPPRDSPERLELVRKLSSITKAASQQREAAEAAKTPEQRQAEQAAADEMERREDNQLREEARYARRKKTRANALDANTAPVVARQKNRFDDSGGDLLANHRGITGAPVGRPTLVRVGEALTKGAKDRTRRGREKWRHEHSARPADFPVKQWTACQLVYGEGLPDGEAGKRMGGITKEAVQTLRKKAGKRGILDPRPW
jgi:hypothetical protein